MGNRGVSMTRLEGGRNAVSCRRRFNKAIVRGVLRGEPAIDFPTAHAAGLRRMKDPEVLALAAGQQRVLVSHDVGTMPAHFRAFREAGKRSAGVFLVAQTLDIGP